MYYWFDIMAIVKFVSDKDCQVFIDMEFAGKVAPDSMLKVTLETGGYLIQIKDDDGHLIKEYDLEIKVSDNQVLQKINESNCQIEGDRGTKEWFLSAFLSSKSHILL